MHPEEGFERRPDDRKEQAGKKPAHDLGINVVLSGLPVGIDPKATQNAADGIQHEYHIRKAEIPAVHFPTGLVKFTDPRRRLGEAQKWQGKKKYNRSCL